MIVERFGPSWKDRSRPRAVLAERSHKAKAGLGKAGSPAELMKGLVLRRCQNFQRATTGDPSGLGRRLDQQPTDTSAALDRRNEQHGDLRRWLIGIQRRIPVRDNEPTRRPPLGSQQRGT
jgi:hypothetical protein